MNPTPLPAPKWSEKQYFLGLGLGFIPLVVYFVAFEPLLSNLLWLSLILYIAAIAAVVLCLSLRGVRWVGYGLLTAVLVSPVVAFISCAVMLSQHPL